MRRLFWFMVLFSLLTGAVLLLGACGGSPTATTATTVAPESTGAGGAPLVTASTTATTASSTTASTTTAVGAGGAGDVGTKGNPIPVGTAATVADWKIKVTSVDLDADAAVKSAPGYQAPDPGSKYVLVNLDATYLAQQPDSFANALGYQIVGSKGDTFDSVDVGLDKSIENTNAVLQGASVSGSLVFEVPSDQVDGALLWMARSSAQTESGTFFALK